MKCQACNETAIHHVTEIVAGEPVEYHVCEVHVQDLAHLQPTNLHAGATGFVAFLMNAERLQALRDPVAREKVAAHILPGLCLALLDQNPQVRVSAAFRLMGLGPDARPVLATLEDAARDPDGRVAEAARIALDWVQNEDGLPWYMY